MDHGPFGTSTFLGSRCLTYWLTHCSPPYICNSFKSDASSLCFPFSLLTNLCCLPSSRLLLWRGGCVACCCSVLYMQHLLHVCLSWEMDISATLPEVSSIFLFPPRWKFFFSQYGKFFLTQIEGLGTEGVVCSTDYTAYWGNVIVILGYINKIVTFLILPCVLNLCRASSHVCWHFCRISIQTSFESAIRPSAADICLKSWENIPFIKATQSFSHANLSWLIQHFSRLACEVTDHHLFETKACNNKSLWCMLYWAITVPSLLLTRAAVTSEFPQCRINICYYILKLNMSSIILGLQLVTVFIMDSSDNYFLH